MENNTIKQQLEHVIREEEELVFDSFTAKDAFAIGGALIARAEKEGKKITVGISLYRRNVFYASMDGCTPVSYTHLDVYKIQVGWIITSLMPSATKRSIA